MLEPVTMSAETIQVLTWIFAIGCCFACVPLLMRIPLRSPSNDGTNWGE